MDNSGLIISALEKTNPKLALSIDAANSWSATIVKKGARVRKYRRYERGDHDADITTQMKKMLRLKTDDADLEDLNDNYMRIVIDKMAGRLHLTTITPGGEAENNQQAADWINEITARNDFDALQGELFRGAIRDGDSYALIDPSNMTWSAEPAYDGHSGIVAIFDPTSKQPLWACKLWSEADDQNQLLEDSDTAQTNMRVVVYEPNRITYWTGGVNGRDVSPISDAVGTSEEIWQYGKIPLVHYANQRDNYTDYGESEIRPAIPLQNILNRTLYSMTMASELSAFKIYYAIGLEIDRDGIVPGSILNLVMKDDAGNIVYDLTAEQVEFLKTVKIGELGGTDLSQYTGEIDKVVREISQATQTPIYGVTTEGNLSGEALKQLETGLIGKIYRFQNENNGAIKRLFTMSAELQNIYQNGLPSAPMLDDVNIVWQSPEILDVNARLNVLIAMREKTAGLWPDSWYREQIGGLLGMKPGQITAEGELAQAQQSGFIESLVGAGGGVPVI